MTENFYEYPYNYSNGTEVNGTGDWMVWTNMTLGGSFGAGILLIIWLASFGISMMLGVKKALLASSFITFIFAVYLSMLGMVNDIIVFFVVILLIVGIIGSAGDKDGGL